MLLWEHIMNNYSGQEYQAQGPSLLFIIDCAAWHRKLTRAYGRNGLNGFYLQYTQGYFGDMCDESDDLYRRHNVVRQAGAHHEKLPFQQDHGCF